MFILLAAFPVSVSYGSKALRISNFLKYHSQNDFCSPKTEDHSKAELGVCGVQLSPFTSTKSSSAPEFAFHPSEGAPLDIRVYAFDS